MIKSYQSVQRVVVAVNVLLQTCKKREILTRSKQDKQTRGKDGCYEYERKIEKKHERMRNACEQTILWLFKSRITVEFLPCSIS